VLRADFLAGTSRLELGAGALRLLLVASLVGSRSVFFRSPLSPLFFLFLFPLFPPLFPSSSYSSRSFIINLGCRAFGATSSSINHQGCHLEPPTAGRACGATKADRGPCSMSSSSSSSSSSRASIISIELSTPHCSQHVAPRRRDSLLVCSQCSIISISVSSVISIEILVPPLPGRAFGATKTGVEHMPSSSDLARWKSGASNHLRGPCHTCRYHDYVGTRSLVSPAMWTPCITTVPSKRLVRDLPIGPGVRPKKPRLDMRSRAPDVIRCPAFRYSKVTPAYRLRSPLSLSSDAGHAIRRASWRAYHRVYGACGADHVRCVRLLCVRLRLRCMFAVCAKRCCVSAPLPVFAYLPFVAPLRRD